MLIRLRVLSRLAYVWTKVHALTAVNMHEDVIREQSLYNAMIGVHTNGLCYTGLDKQQISA